MGGITYRDLNATHTSQIKQAIMVARRAIAGAKQELRRARTSPSVLVGRYFKITTTQGKDASDLNVILGRFNLVAGALLGHENLVFDGETTGPAFNLGRLVGKNAAAYVWGPVPAGSGREGVVKIVKARAFQGGNRRLARTLIHELCHLYAGCDLDEYHGGGGAIRIDRSRALRNADTYAHFALPETRSPSLRAPLQPGHR